jgi:hypothetical protein
MGTVISNRVLLGRVHRNPVSRNPVNRWTVNRRRHQSDVVAAAPRTFLCTNNEKEMTT